MPQRRTVEKGPDGQAVQALSLPRTCAGGETVLSRAKLIGWRR